MEEKLHTKKELPHGELSLIVMDNMKEVGSLVDEELKRLHKIDDPSFTFKTDISEIRFSNGEGKVVINESVRGKDIYILSDIGNHGQTYKMFGMDVPMGPDEHFQDIKRVISAVNGKGRRISVIMPLLYQSRQDRRKARESLDCAMALKELENLGVHSIYTFDVHDPNVQNAIPTLSFENIYPTAEIVDAFIKHEGITSEYLDDQNLIIISPDAGAMSRAIHYSNLLEQDIGMFYKRRDFTKVVDGTNPIVEHRYLGKDVEGRSILIVDDMIASGGTILDICRELKARKADKIYCAASFAFFTSGAGIFDEYVEKGWLDKVYSTNLTYVPDEILEKEWFQTVDTSGLLAEFIYHVHFDITVSDILDKTRGLDVVPKAE